MAHFLKRFQPKIKRIWNYVSYIKNNVNIGENEFET